MYFYGWNSITDLKLSFVWREKRSNHRNGAVYWFPRCALATTRIIHRCRNGVSTASFIAKWNINIQCTESNRDEAKKTLSLSAWFNWNWWEELFNDVQSYDDIRSTLKCFSVPLKSLGAIIICADRLRWRNLLQTFIELRTLTRTKNTRQVKYFFSTWLPWKKKQ